MCVECLLSCAWIVLWCWYLIRRPVRRFLLRMLLSLRLRYNLRRWLRGRYRLLRHVPPPAFLSLISSVPVVVPFRAAFLRRSIQSMLISCQKEGKKAFLYLSGLLVAYAFQSHLAAPPWMAKSWECRDPFSFLQRSSVAKLFSRKKILTLFLWVLFSFSSNFSVMLPHTLFDLVPKSGFHPLTLSFCTI